MVGTTGAGLRVKEEEIELDLGLSIGGSFGKKEKVLFSQYQQAVDSKPDDCLNANLKENLPLAVFDSEQESGGFVDDPQRKRAMQALRRQEAKKKREEKQQKKGQGRVKNGECFHGGFLEQIERRVKDREEKEKEADNDGERARKNEKLEHTESETHSVNPYHIMPMQYPYPPLQYVPYANGFAIPCVMPCWAAGGNEKNAFQPEACRSFLPFREQSTGLKMTNGDSDGENRKIASNGSSICSSVISDFQSSSHEGGGSSDSKSNSSPSLPAHPQLNCCSTVDDDVKAQFEHTASSSSPVESSQGIVENPNSDKKIKEEAISEAPPAPSNNANSTTKTTSPAPLKETKGNLGKPPKPQTHNNSNITTSSLLQMPCVSTTGNGPNGKTINGFLFRYTKTEVSIVCVCHGSSFSPAEFVQHAGGTNVTNPLRHITVIPSAFG